MSKRKKVSFKTRYGKVSFMTKNKKTKFGKSKFDVMREERRKGIVK